LPGDETAAIVKGAGQTTMDLIKTIDGALESASGGGWARYMETYADKSKPVTSARASQGIRDQYAKEGAPQLAGVPQVTGTNLGRAIDKHGTNGSLRG
jgi:hypothetical protein